MASRAELEAAVNTVIEVTPAPDTDDDEEWRTELVGRFATVRPFLGLLTYVITFGATAEGALVLAAMRALPDVLRRGRRTRRGDLEIGVVPGSWRRLVFGTGGGAADAVHVQA